MEFGNVAKIEISFGIRKEKPENGSFYLAGQQKMACSRDLHKEKATIYRLLTITDNLSLHNLKKQVSKRSKSAAHFAGNVQFPTPVVHRQTYDIGRYADN